MKFVTVRKGKKIIRVKHKQERVKERRTLYRRKKGFLEGLYEGAEIQLEALRRGKNLAFSKDTCLEKKKVRLKVTTRRVEVELKRRGELNKRTWGWKLAWWGSIEKKRGLTFARIKRKTPILRPALQSNQSSLCDLHRSRDRGGEGSNGQVVSITRTADGRKQENREIIDKKRKKYRTKNGSLRNPSTNLKGATFVTLKNHTSAPIRKDRLSPTSQARRETNRNEFVEKGRMPDRVKSFREIDSSKNCMRVGLGFVKPVRNGLRKEQNLI